MLKTMLGALGVVAVLAPGDRSTFDAEEVLQRSFAAYAALAAYADSGTVAVQTSGFTDRYAFRTYFTRQPRNLLLDFAMVETEYTNGHKFPGAGGTVVWMENGHLQTYDRKSLAHEVYPEDGGRQVDAIKGAGYGTKGVSLVVPSLLYTKAGLASVIQATEEATAAGTETVDGRPCLKVTGIERWRYPSGQVTGVRPVTIWIDAETYLIRKVFQDTPKSMGRGAIERQTTTYRPYADPRLAPTHFHYQVPE